MADKKITELNPIVEVQDNDILVVVDTSEGQTSRITKLELEQSLRLSEIQGTTTDVAEGDNLYYTQQRFDLALAAKTTDDVAEGSVNKYLTLQNLTDLISGGSFTTDQVPEGTTNLYFTDARADANFATKTTDDLTQGSVNRYWSQALFDTAFAGKTTSGLAEGSNLYYTNARFDARLSTKSTDDIAEGSNLYYTQSRFDAGFAAKTTDDLNEGSSNLYYTNTRFDQRFATRNTDQLSEGSTNLYYTEARFNNSLSQKSTSDLVEGSNLYFTQARFDAAFGGKTADALPEGLINQYYTDAKVDSRIAVQKGQPNGLASLGADGKVLPGQIDKLYVSEVYVVNTIAERDALLANPGLESGDTVHVTNATPQGQRITYIYDGAAFIELKSFDAVESVNGKVGTVVLTTTDVAEGTNLYWTGQRFDDRFATRTTDQLQEGIGNLYFTQQRVVETLNVNSITEFQDVNIIDQFRIPGYYISWDGVNWVATPPQAFSDTKDIKVTGVDLFPGFLDTKIEGTPGRLVLNTFDSDGNGNFKISFDVGPNILDTTSFTTDDLTEGTNNLYYTTERAQDAIGTILIDTASLKWTYDDNAPSISANVDMTAFTTSDLAEGLNLYYTEARFDQRLSTKTTTDLAEGANLYYTETRVDANFATKTTDDLTEGSNLYYTEARFDARLATKTTDDLTEGSNLYYTVVRWDQRLATKTTDDLTEGSNLYYTEARVDANFASKTTDDLTEGSNLYYTDVRVNAFIDTIRGMANGLAELDTNGKVPLAQLPDDVLGTLQYQGMWNAATNTPTITSGTGTKGHYYVVNVAGTTNVDGITDWQVGDWIVFNGTAWEKIDNTDKVSSVNGKTGAVILTTTDIAEGTNLYYTVARFDSRLATKTTDDLAEGSNLYYTQARFDTAFAAKSTSDLSEGTNLYYTEGRVDANFATKTTDDLAEGSSNLYYASSLFDADLATKTTSDLAEGSNLYYTEARFDTSFSGKTTDDLTEGSTNQFLTDERVQDIVGAFIQNGTGLNWTYNDLGNVLVGNVTLDDFDTGDLAEGSNLYYTQARFDSAFGAKDTGDLSEGSNLYYTNSRAITAIGGTVNDGGGNTDDIWSGDFLQSQFLLHFLKSEHVNTSTGPADAGKPVVLAGNGKLDPSIIGSLGTEFWSADQFENPVNADWAVNNLAPSRIDSNNNGINVRLFDDTTEEGIGFSTYIPTDAVNITIRFLSRAETAPPGARTVGVQLYERGIVGGVDAWSAGTQLANVNIGTNENWVETVQTFTLASLGLTPGQVHQFELTRVNPTSGTELLGDWALQWLRVEFS